MNRPASKELTERELELMHVFWENGSMTASQARERLVQKGVKIAYVTVANLVRILTEKNCLEAENDSRPFRYRPIRSFKDVSKSLVGDLMKRVFHGSREQLLVQVLSSRKKLTAKERELLERVLKEQS